jgi:L-ascorbate metabolism protein UlaG (beta-lactamase superfamily)
MKLTWYLVPCLSLSLAASAPDQGGHVRITPLGQRTGNFCSGDRALLFEDPSGVRILYDPGNTIAGASDARLGGVHVILISHAHGDHLGSARLTQDPNSDTASCAGGGTTAAPNTNTAEIASAKSSAVIAGGPLASVIGRLIAAVTGSATPGCGQSGLTNEFTVPRAAPCTAGLGIGAKRTVRHASASSGVQITAVTANHTNELASSLLAEPERTDLAANGLGAYVGLANGFVLTFTNGLKVYLSGDTGLTSDMDTIVRGLYGVELAVINIGDIFTTGPEEAAFAVTRLIRPVSVIPSHVNEAATSSGTVTAGTRTERFIQLVAAGGAADRAGRMSVFPPLSGVTMEFDAHGRCQAGC